MAIRELALTLRPLDSQVVDDLPLGDVETKTKLVVEVHIERMKL